ncbi:uncharacterized protein PF11_0207-like [Orbicella faveolata]|uniref:uncharacterized protein PF11_0207-like n=1 Tax=Orbicella faveolata TaxID=48498 RepID=UPI0009E5E05D|nr:uncharacterized protein PF11_0207-like [Orbicella faveolata]
MAEQANIEAVLAENQRLRQSLVVMVTDRKKMASKLTGVQNLGLQLQKKEQQIKTLLEKNERLEGSLARAENRITQLNLQLPSGAQIGAVVTPGVSKKVLEALTRDNTKLKQALEHLTNKGPAGVDLAVENRDLHEIIITLRDERDMKSNEVKELKIALDAVQGQNTDGLKNQVLRLTALVTKLERNLNAKQVFCETVVTENDTLKNELQSLKDDRILQLREMKKELGQHTRSPEVRRILNRVYDSEDGNPEEATTSEEVKKLKEEVKKLTDELQSKREEIEQIIAEHSQITNYLFIHLQQKGMRPRGYGMEVTADGPDFTDSPSPSQGSQLQCPNCRKYFPHDLLENHMRDCTGDD